MSLLTEASLIVTPNAYKAGKLYSVIPNTNLGDMDVSRALSATRVNSAGLIEIAKTNLLLRSEEFDNVAWNKGTGGSISPNSVISPIGTLTADAYTWAGSTTAFAYLSQPVSAISQNSNTFSIWLKRPLGSGSRTIRLSISDVNIFTANSLTFTVTETWTRFEFTSASLNTTGSVGVGLYTGASGTSIAAGEILDVWGAQLEQSNAVATDYIPTTTVARTKFAGITQDGPYGANIPRIDYPPLGGCPSILSEPARTNEILYSEEFDNIYWTKVNATISANATNSPSNTLTADKFIPDAANSVHFIEKTGLASNAYTFSVFAKAGGETTFSLWLRNASISARAEFNLSTGTIILKTATSATIEPYPNGWYRCSVYDSTPGTTAHIYGRGGGGFQPVNVTDGIFLWGAQVEAASTATSYMPTTSIPFTRNADATYNTSATTLIGQTEGTIYAEFIGTKDILGVNKYICIIGGGSKSIHIAFYLAVINIVSSPPIDLSVSFTPNLNYKIAVCYSNTGNFRVYVNGFKYHEVNTYVPSTFSTLGIGNTVAGTNQVNSNIKSAVLWKTALTDDQCILLTGASFSTYPEMANNFPNTLIYTLQ